MIRNQLDPGKSISRGGVDFSPRQLCTTKCRTRFSILSFTHWTVSVESRMKYLESVNMHWKSLDRIFFPQLMHYKLFTHSSCSGSSDTQFQLHVPLTLSLFEPNWKEPTFINRLYGSLQRFLVRFEYNFLPQLRIRNFSRTYRNDGFFCCAQASPQCIQYKLCCTSTKLCGNFFFFGLVHRGHTRINCQLEDSMTRG